jgi:hypothetical protein
MSRDVLCAEAPGSFPRGQYIRETEEMELNDSTFSFMPVANNRSAPERTRMEPGEYRATCTAIRPPEVYRAFKRWYMRVDFAIHGDGQVMSKYINLGIGEKPNMQLGPRTDYYKLWVQAVGRKPEHNEPMDPARIVGVDFLVTVGDKSHGGAGEVYSTVESVRRELERRSEPERLNEPDRCVEAPLLVSQNNSSPENSNELERSSESKRLSELERLEEPEERGASYETPEVQRQRGTRKEPHETQVRSDASDSLGSISQELSTACSIGGLEPEVITGSLEEVYLSPVQQAYCDGLSPEDKATYLTNVLEYKREQGLKQAA